MGRRAVVGGERSFKSLIIKQSFVIEEGTSVWLKCKIMSQQSLMYCVLRGGGRIERAERRIGPDYSNLPQLPERSDSDLDWLFKVVKLSHEKQFVEFVSLR